MLALFSRYPVDSDAIVQYLESKYIHDPDFYAMHRPGVNPTEIAEEKLADALEDDGAIVIDVNLNGLVYVIDLAINADDDSVTFELDYWNHTARTVNFEPFLF